MSSFREKKLDPNSLGLLAVAFSKNLFPKPIKGDAYVNVEENFYCTLYFTESYFLKLQSHIANSQKIGKFSESNAEASWNKLKDDLDSARIISDLNTENLQDYLFPPSIY